MLARVLLVVGGLVLGAAWNWWDQVERRTQTLSFRAPDPGPTPEPALLEPAPVAPARAGGGAGTLAPSPRFEGKGVIRGEVGVREGVAFPERWVLRVGPHPFLEGRERAVQRRIEFTHGERVFRVEDLPLAGYLVIAEAPGLNNVPCSVLLVQGSKDQFVSTAFLPAGLLDGAVLDAGGRPVEGLDVTLESSDTHIRRTASTDASGFFHFPGVTDGEYRIQFGPQDAPLLPPEPLAFQAPSLRFPTRTLPPSGGFLVLTVDEQGRPIPRAVVRGFGDVGGSIDAFSDEQGKLPLRWLRPGRYRLDATGGAGLSGGAAAELQVGKQDLEVVLVMRRRTIIR